MLSEIDGVRVAVVGCAHGGFDEIYALLKAKAEEKGWDTIDLVIIGGDFQALRNANDAACISVPAKWKSMGDFYKYYGGEAVAPYLTIFCGGNHEASNYMYELYYGGWAAPNIYYLGAANIICFGPLRISAMSGIWKGYDFRKPHFERLPYNSDDLHSVYHIRELDVRKLLQVRTQVDIGLSHDWPRGIEYFGDHRQLFRKKRGFQEDSEHGRLGNAAARDVLERLRPAYWFSAHLHVKFAAALAHDGATLAKISFPVDQPAVWAVEAQAPVVSSKAAPVTNKVLPASGTAQEKIQAWNNFAQGGAQAFERQERRVMEQEWMETVRRQDERRTVPKDQPSQGDVGQPTPGQNEDEIDLDSGSESGKTGSNTGPAPMISNKVLSASGTTQEKIQAWNDFAEGGAQEFESQQRRVMEQEWMDTIRRQGERHAVSKDQRSQGNGDQSTPGRNEDEIDLNSGGESDKSHSRNPSPAKAPKLAISSSDGSNDDVATAGESLVDRAVTEGLRGKLPASFARPAAESTHKKLETPDITNKLTRFLALDKPHNRDDFMHLVKINPIKSTGAHTSPENFRLEYDKEWLAITRVFANDLVLGDATAQVPANKGEEYYRARILEEEEWVEKHIVDESRMQIPYNFQPSAPNFDPDVPLTTTEQPMEYTNSQTAEFCKLLDIPNKFDLTESEREARMNAGPRAAGARHGGRGRGGGRGGRGRGSWGGPRRGHGRGGARLGGFNAS